MATVGPRLDSVASPRTDKKDAAGTSECVSMRKDPEPRRKSVANGEHKDSVDLGSELGNLKLEDTASPASARTPGSDKLAQNPEQHEKALTAKEKKKIYDKEKKQRSKARKAAAAEETAIAKEYCETVRQWAPPPIPQAQNPNAFPSRSLGGLCIFARLQRAEYMKQLLERISAMEDATYNRPDGLSHSYMLSNCVEVIALCVIYWDAQLTNYLSAHQKGLPLATKGELLQHCLLNMRSSLETEVRKLNREWMATSPSDLDIANEMGRRQIYGSLMFPFFDDSRGHCRIDQAMPDVRFKICDLIKARDPWFRSIRFSVAGQKIEDSDPAVCYDNLLEHRKDLIARLGNAAEALCEKVQGGQVPFKDDMMPLSTLAQDIKDSVAIQIFLQEPKLKPEAEEEAKSAMHERYFPEKMDELAQRKDAVNALVSLSQGT